MRLYLDKSNLVSFIKNAESLGGELYQDCKRMIKRHLHVHYNFAKDELSGADNLLMAWFLGNGTTGHGYGENTDTFLSCEYPNRPVKSNFLKDRDVDDHMAVYLLDEDVSSLQKSNTVLIGGVGEEIAIFKHLVFADYSFHRLHDIQNKSEFSGWEQLDQQGDILPTSDILILDRYLFGGAKDIQEVDLENNLYTILGLYAKKNLQKINIVFFCDGVRNSKVWSDRKSKIEKIFKKENKNCAVRITFVFYAKSFPKDRYEEVRKLYPHDRILITNYRMLRSGDSFCYYNSKGDLITNGLHLDIDSLANAQNYNYMKSIIQYSQTIYDDIKNLGNSDLIYGDKESNYIVF